MIADNCVSSVAATDVSGSYDVAVVFEVVDGNDYLNGFSATPFELHPSGLVGEEERSVDRFQESRYLNLAIYNSKEIACMTLGSSHAELLEVAFDVDTCAIVGA